VLVDVLELEAVGSGVLVCYRPGIPCRIFVELDDVQRYS
jgi:hypothetical protein